MGCIAHEWMVLCTHSTEGGGGLHEVLRVEAVCGRHGGGVVADGRGCHGVSLQHGWSHHARSLLETADRKNNEAMLAVPTCT